MMETQKERIIIDTDPGVDDAFALVLAFAEERFMIEGITIVHGNNADLDILARNACKVMELCNSAHRPCNFPVFKGASESLNGTKPAKSGEQCHGSNGLGDVAFDEPKNLHLIHPSKSAAEFIVETCTKYPKEVTLITLGPFTNLALAYQLDPTLNTKIKRISAMAGVFLTPGNVGPLLEANTFNDPEAAEVVFSRRNASVPILLFPLDTTHRVHMDPPFRTKLRSSGKIGAFLADVLEFYKRQNVEWGVLDERIPLHDACAVLGLARPDLFRGQDGDGLISGPVGWSGGLRVEVETQGKWTRGQTVADWSCTWGSEDKNVHISLGVDQASLKDYFFHLLQRIHTWTEK